MCRSTRLSASLIVLSRCLSAVCSLRDVVKSFGLKLSPVKNEEELVFAFDVLSASLRKQYHNTVQECPHPAPRAPCCSFEIIRDHQSLFQVFVRGSLSETVFYSSFAAPFFSYSEHEWLLRSTSERNTLSLLCPDGKSPIHEIRVIISSRGALHVANELLETQHNPHSSVGNTHLWVMIIQISCMVVICCRRKRTTSSCVHFNKSKIHFYVIGKDFDVSI